MRVHRFVRLAFVPIFGWSLAYAQTVKITPLGSHAGELCANDRALLFEDPTGLRLLYDAGMTVAGGSDPRLGDVHVVLLSHAHPDHIGIRKVAGLNAGTCSKPETVSARPHSNTAGVAAAKNSALAVSGHIAAFLGRKIQNIRGEETARCPTAGLSRETTVPVPRHVWRICNWEERERSSFLVRQAECKSPWFRPITVTIYLVACLPVPNGTIWLPTIYLPMSDTPMGTSSVSQMV